LAESDVVGEPRKPRKAEDLLAVRQLPDLHVSHGTKNLIGITAGRCQPLAVRAKGDVSNAAFPSEKEEPLSRPHVPDMNRASVRRGQALPVGTEQRPLLTRPGKREKHLLCGYVPDLHGAVPTRKGDLAAIRAVYHLPVKEGREPGESVGSLAAFNI